MTAIILEFPGSQRSHRTRGVCVHCLGRYPVLTDYSCYGFGKWCDGCEPILRELVQRLIDGETAEEIVTRLKSHPASSRARRRP
jgi:hypothetical protein